MLLPESQFLEMRDGAYFVAESRISLGSIAWAVRRGESLDEILADFPLLPSREVLEGVVGFVRTHPLEIDAYLTDGQRRWKEGRRFEAERVERIHAEKGMKPA